MSDILPIAKIHVGHRLRKLVPDHVKTLAESISEIGLRQPISVVQDDAIPYGPGIVSGYRLIAGMHRLEAHKMLGRTEIAGDVVELDHIDQRLWEIDENLCHAALDPLEYSEHLAERKVLYIEKYPNTAAGNAGASARWDATAKMAVAFVDDTAAKTGKSVRNISRSVRIAEKIAPDVRDQIRSTPMAQSVIELEALAGIKSPEVQMAVVQAVKSGEAKTVRQAIRTTKPKAEAALDTKRYNALMHAWKVATDVARERFLRKIGAVGG